MNQERKATREEMRKTLEVLAYETKYGFPVECLKNYINLYNKRFHADNWMRSYLKKYQEDL